MTKIAVFLSCLFASSAFAAVTLPAMGALTSAGGGPVADGIYAMKFKLYETATSVDPLWQETNIGVQVIAGKFVVDIGAQNPKDPISDDFFVTHTDSWLGVQVFIDPELPRAHLQYVPYALFSKVAASAKVAVDLSCTGCVDLSDLAPGVLEAKNIAFSGTTVASYLGGLDSAVKTLQDGVVIQGQSIGLGKAPAAKCGVDISTSAGTLCVDGAPGLLTRNCANAAEMVPYASEGQIVVRTDLEQPFVYLNGKWRKMLIASECGDGQIEVPEECDDGNNIDTDACLSSCKNPKCGDTFIQNAVETCDGGNLAGASCVSVMGAGTTGNLACAADCKSFDTSNCKGPLGTVNNAAKDCKAIFDGGFSKGSGVYYLQSALGTVAAYCDMTAGSAGWTLLSSWDTELMVAPKAFGLFSSGEPNPSPTTKHALPFISIVPNPVELRVVYEGNGQTLSLTAAGVWEKNSLSARIKLSDGKYLVYAGEHCSSAFCVINPGYYDNFNCDGNGGQIAGQGLFESCAADEFCSCSEKGWKFGAGGCAPTVCPIVANVAVFAR